MLNKYYCYLLLLLLLLCSHVPIDYYYLTSENYETSLYRYYLTIAHHQNIMRSLIFTMLLHIPPTPISKNNNIIGTQSMLSEPEQKPSSIKIDTIVSTLPLLIICKNGVRIRKSLQYEKGENAGLVLVLWYHIMISYYYYDANTSWKMQTRHGNSFLDPAFAHS